MGLQIFLRPKAEPRLCAEHKSDLNAMISASFMGMVGSRSVLRPSSGAFTSTCGQSILRRKAPEDWRTPRRFARFGCVLHLNGPVLALLESPAFSFSFPNFTIVLRVMARKESAAPHRGWSDIIGIVLIASGLLLLVAQFSFERSDVHHEPRSENLHNWIGKAGAYGANLSFLLFG